MEQIRLLSALTYFPVPLALCICSIWICLDLAPCILQAEATSHGPIGTSPLGRLDSLSLIESPSGWSKSPDPRSSALNSWQPTILIRTTVTLTWTAPGDDGQVGRATAYEFRYSPQAITPTNFVQASKVVTLLTPAAAGTRQTLRIMGLPSNQLYHFAQRTADEAANWSELSNVTRDSARTSTATCGDVDGNGALSISDEIALVAFIFSAGPRPDPIQVADMDCSGYISVTDAVYFIRFIFHGGTPPCCVK